MRIFIILATIFFVISAFIGNFHFSISISFISFMAYQLNLFMDYFFIFMIGFCIVFLLFMRKNFPGKKITLPIIFHTLVQITYGLFISIFSAFVILIVIALIELNIFSVILSFNPSLLGAKTDTWDIYNSIKKNNRPPEIIASDKNSQKAVIAIAKASGGQTNFYGDKILSAIPNFFIIPVKKTPSNLLLLDDTLIVTGLNIEDMQIISPLIGYLFIKQYFPLRDIKSSPKIEVMSENEFQKYRVRDMNEKLMKIKTETGKMEYSIVELTEVIEKDKQDIADNSISQENILKSRDKEYNVCLSKGIYKSGTFIPQNTKEDCQIIISNWEDDFISEADKEKELVKKLENDQNKLKEYQYYLDFFKAQEQLTDFSGENISSELGVFEPADSIKVVINSSSSTSIADFFGNLCHEYLHYASYTDGKRLESFFFEEGLTEYFARRTIKDSMQVNTNNGYPVEVKIIEELINKTVESDFADLYFSKNQLGLERAMNLVYGNNFYKDNIVLFESLLYFQDPEQKIETANSIMEKIGGEEINKSDIYSTKSYKL